MNIELIPPNLAKLGVQRMTPGGEADLETIWMTPYPVITNYLKLCKDVDILKPFGGGRRIRQIRNKYGYITSGYRDKILYGNSFSAHLFGFALDIFVGNVEQQILVGKKALNYYSRIGLYPDSNFIHVDLAPEIWIKKYNKAPFWVIKIDSSKSFNNFKDAAKFAA